MESFLSLIAIPIAFVLDICLGDPKWLPHPIRWMGAAILFWEPRFRKLPVAPARSGALFTGFLVLSTALISGAILGLAEFVHPHVKTGLEIIMIHYCLSSSGLADAALEIKALLDHGNVDEARKKVALVVGRDVTTYGRDDISRATVETVGENLADGFVAPLFFAVIGGAPAALAYKMANTLDSMTGYKDERYIQFGKASARLDDLLNFLPARLSVPVIALSVEILKGKNGRQSFKTAFREGRHHASPNAGYPEAAFAGGLEVKMGGPNDYHGQRLDKPWIGIHFGDANPSHIGQACDVMWLSSFLWTLIAWAGHAFFFV